MYYELKLFKNSKVIIRRMFKDLRTAVYFYCELLENYNILDQINNSFVRTTQAFGKIANKRYVFINKIPEFELMIIKRGKSDINKFLIEEYIKDYIKKKESN